MWPLALSIMLAPAARPPLMSSRALTCSFSRAVHTQAHAVAVSGSYAYVTGAYSDSLVTVDISNPQSPVIRGSVVSSSLLDHVREARGAAGGWRRPPPHRTSNRTRGATAC